MSATILLADDSPTIQKVVELTFAETEYRVVAVSSGTELLEKLPEVRPDVVICDVIMPERDGYDVCQTIKSSPEMLHIPVVLLTGTFEPFDRDRAMAVGCDDIVTKPFEARQLIATVEKLVKGGGVGEEQPAIEEEEFGTYLVAPPAAEAGPAGEAPAEPAPIAETGEPSAAAAPVPGEAPASAPDAGEAVPEEGLDFTTTGFAEMEAAGQQPHVPMEPPAEGIEVDEEMPMEIPVPERQKEDAAPWREVPEETPEAPAFEPEAVPGTSGAGGEASPWSGGSEEAPVASPVGGEVAPEVPEQPAEEATTMPPAEAGPSPSDTAPVEPAGEPAWEFQEETPPPAVEEPAETAFPEPPSVAAEELPPAEAPSAPAVEESPVARAPAVEPPGPEPAAAPSLSDEDVDRIARRVVELFAERLEQIAWEVLPDMAEIVVRERVREIEEAIEESGAGS